MSNEREGLRQRLEQIEAEMARSDPRFVSKEVREIVELGRKVLSLLTQAQEPVGYVVVSQNGSAWQLRWPQRYDYVDARMEAPARDVLAALERDEPERQHRVLTLYASPVASAPCREDEAHAAGMMAATHDAHSQLADVAGRMKTYGYDAETLRVLTEHIFGGAEIPMPASAPEEEREAGAKIADELQEAAPIYMRDDEASTLGWVLDWLRATHTKEQR